MKKCSTLLIIFCLFHGIKIGHAQSGEFNSMVAQLQQTIAPVQTGSKSYVTQIEAIEPGILKYSFDETDQKGNKTNYAYEFNLADIDAYAVRELTQKDAIYSILAVRNKQKLIKVYKNNEVQSYDLQVSIIAKDIESARTINGIIKKAILVSEKIAENRINVSGYDAMATWLTNNIKNVSLGSKTYTQTVTKGDAPGALIYKVVETDSKGSTENQYTLNLADIDIHSINFKISGNSFNLLMATAQKAKYIEVKRNNETRPYIHEIEINTNNVDEARDIKTVLTKIIPLAVEKVKSDMPKVNSEKDGLQKIQSFTVDFTVGAIQINQSITDQCYCTFTQTQRDAKSTVTDVYQFNWMDLNPNGSVIGVSGDKLYVNLKTHNSTKTIMRTQNEKFNGYENSILLYMPNIENARRVKAAMDLVIEKCTANYKYPFGNNAGGWLVSNIKDVTLDDVTQNQMLEFVESGNTDKVKFVRRTINSKGAGSEEIYEFQLSDMDPMSIKTEVKGKWLYVIMETNFKNKIIKAYKDGNIQPYINKLEFAINDTELAKNISEALKKSIADKKK